ncbi:hypothetical protein NUH88_03555 [Nisaea acidiphila]|uniref:Antitoxin Xre/MbcA/ParS-like toxin-binding domain-containing protein n=1 Tax=Nisaea acidiphila TaxID=1862145 RepID=A0A9J7AZB0_9PROT|nr:hypothetical protein [Nisaea acidiphila]UUX50781.1 hypothetical protein NUH88_03555 [Nisaea acidiphila]
MSGGDSQSAGRFQRVKERKELTPVAVRTIAGLFDLWQVPAKTAAKLMNVDEGTWAAMSDGSWQGVLSVDQLERTSSLVALYRDMKEALDEDEADCWVTTGNANGPFRGKAPVDVMALGGLPVIQAVRRHVKTLQPELVS